MSVIAINVGIRVECVDEIGTSSKPAEVRIYDGTRLALSIQAVIDRKQGADGGWYPCVVFKEQKP
jgi:hypothetical protein